MIFQSVQLNNGKILDGDKIGELVAEIVNKFSENGLSCDEAKIILERTKAVLGEFSTYKKFLRDFSAALLAECKFLSI